MNAKFPHPFVPPTPTPNRSTFCMWALPFQRSIIFPTPLYRFGFWLLNLNYPLPNTTWTVCVFSFSCFASHPSVVVIMRVTSIDCLYRRHYFLKTLFVIFPPSVSSPTLCVFFFEFLSPPNGSERQPSFFFS